jgi:hypothetical protein
MAVVGMETMTDSAAKADGTVVANFMAIKPFMAETGFVGVEASRAAASAAGTRSTVAEVSMAGVVSTAVAAAGNCYSFLLSNLNGWRFGLPAVFFCS